MLKKNLASPRASPGARPIRPYPIIRCTLGGSWGNKTIPPPRAARVTNNGNGNSGGGDRRAPDDRGIVDGSASTDFKSAVVGRKKGWYGAWRGLLVGAAAVAGFAVPFQLAFGGDPASFYDPSAGGPAAAVEAVCVLLFCADIGERLR